MQLSKVSRSISRCAFAGFAGLIMATSVGAQNLGTVFSDLWWDPIQSGWGTYSCTDGTVGTFSMNALENSHGHVRHGFWEKPVLPV